MRRLGLEPPTKNGVPNRELKIDGTVVMPFDREALPLLRSMPGARWNPDKKVWTVSTKVGDLRRVIGVADQLELKVPDELRNQAEKGTPEMREAKKRASHKGLYEFQRAGVEFLALHEGALLADDMGLGKTVQTLVALPKKPKVICVCPANVKYNWEDEANKWRPDLKVTVLSGRGSFQLPEAGEIVVVNYDILPQWLLPIKKGKGPAVTIEQRAVLAETILVADEAQLVKKYKSARAKKINSLSRLCKRVWFLTGTPLENKPPDLFGVVTAGNMNPFGGWDRFVGLFNGISNGYGIIWGMPKPEVPERMKRIMLRRMRPEVMKDLPPKTYQNITINNLDKGLQKRLDELLIEAVKMDWLSRGEDPNSKEFTRLKRNLNLLADTMKGLPDFDMFSEIRAILAEARIPAMLEIVETYEESETPLVVFSAHKKPVEELGKRDGWAFIHGNTPAKRRRDLVKSFQSGELKGLALTIKAGGIGITLTRASHALFVDLDWIPGANIQAEDRLDRIGQTADKVLIKIMRSNHPLDKHVQALIVRKMETMRKALEEEIKFKPPRNFDKPPPDVVEESDEDLRARLQALEDAAKEAERQEAVSWVHNILGREIAKAVMPEPKLTTRRINLIKEALGYMIGRCDGARTKDGMGFNKPDAAIAHWIFRTGLRDDDEVTLRVTERILSRYFRQLGEGFGEIWKPAME
jgi:SNF2 family DNA or RNA helicase